MMTEHPLALGSLWNWLRLLRTHGGIDRRYIPRVVFVMMANSFFAPFQVYERYRYGRLVRRTAIRPAPIFIVGHWRSGTTYLHHLMCRNPEFGYLTNFQALAPQCCLVGEKTFKPALARIAAKRHPTREIDNIPLSLDAPEEQDLAIATMSPYSFLHLLTFPRQAPKIFERFALFKDLPANVFAQWKHAYLTVMRKATLSSGGKRLVVKNCVDCARIDALLELFPEAKFIHIYRNPYHVFRSTLRLHLTLLPMFQVQDIDRDQVVAYILESYTRLMRKYLNTRSRIPKGNLVEVGFEELEAAPLDQLQRIYDRLGLPGFAGAEPALRAYIESIAGYQKNVYTMTDETVRQVNRHWRFALDQWGYAPV